MPPMLAAALPALVGGLDGLHRAAVPGGRVMVAPVAPPHNSRAAACGAAQPPLWQWSVLRRRLACRCTAGVTRRTSLFPERPEAHSTRRRQQPGAAASRCSCAPTRSITTTPTSACRRSATSRSTTALDARSRQGHLRPEDQAPARRRQCPADRGGRHASPTARSSTSATTSATASSIRCGSTARSRPDSPPRAPIAATATITVFQSGVYTACEPCTDDPRKPPKWQVKAARIIHDQGEKMIYFEDAALEFFGMPLAYLPVLLGARSDRQAQDRLPDADVSSSSVYGYAVDGAVLSGRWRRTTTSPSRR